MRSVVVAGASLAGLTAARALRRSGYDGSLTLIGQEPHLPYDRPPLSKEVLAGAWEPDRTDLTRPADDDLELQWLLGSAATGLDPDGRRVRLADGAEVPYDGLVIATGSTPRHLPGVDAWDGVHLLRTRDDCMAISRALDAAPRRVVVVGAGFIGAEVAATCRGRGLPVTLVEPLPVPLGRVLGEDLGGVLADIHRDEGVDLRLGVGVTGVEGGDRVERVLLSDGTFVDCDLVVVGVGVTPNTEWLDGSGLPVDDGVVADATCRVRPGIVAAGDVARWHHDGYGEFVRIEHWDNAIEQGAHAAASLLAGDAAEPFVPVPWFWSDQYDRKVMVAGRMQGADEVRVVEGSVDERRFVALFRRDDQVVAAFGMNRPGPVARWRARLGAGVVWADALVDADARNG